jgi:hypothetical protein
MVGKLLRVLYDTANCVYHQPVLFFFVPDKARNRSPSVYCSSALQAGTNLQALISPHAPFSTQVREQIIICRNRQALCVALRVNSYQMEHITAMTLLTYVPEQHYTSVQEPVSHTDAPVFWAFSLARELLYSHHCTQTHFPPQMSLPGILS